MSMYDACGGIRPLSETVCPNAGGPELREPLDQGDRPEAPSTIGAAFAAVNPPMSPMAGQVTAMERIEGQERLEIVTIYMIGSSLYLRESEAIGAASTLARLRNAPVEIYREETYIAFWPFKTISPEGGEV